MSNLGPEDAFRSAMRRMAATVSLITTWRGGPKGMTATAVTPLSMDPPSILICVNQSAALHATLEKSEKFCVNLLQTEQLDLAMKFSSSALRDIRFDDDPWILDAERGPYLENAQASIFCRKAQANPFGTHSIIVGEVEGARFRDASDPLVYLGGEYGLVQKL